jgi:hypothetical protein
MWAFETLGWLISYFSWIWRSFLHFIGGVYGHYHRFILLALVLGVWCPSCGIYRYSTHAEVLIS